MSTETCSFCGRPESDCGELMQGEAGVGELAARICGECALGCAEALGAERRIQEARRSQRPPMLSETAVAGEGAAWSTFTVDGEPWEWHYQRAMGVTRNRVTRLSIRRPGDAAPTIVDMPEGAEPTEANASFVEAATRSAQPEAENEVVQEWTPSLVRPGEFEWRAERASRWTGGERAVVHVRHVASGRHTSMEIAASVTPTVDDALTAAALLGSDAKPDPE